ncbi:MAG TPA: hypothetical protein PKK06_11885 [Phycisphaerae bacterium]|nr:hypothetical protein [Phycisphaerae bacterium]HNU46007.1 hypothetical protein [Phycisphaerae bacterium]
MNIAPYPKRVTAILNKWHTGAVTAQDCMACSSSCCSHGGFAILENVLAIFELYERGELKREDYRFPEGLCFRDFVRTYFDVFWCPTGRWPWRKQIAVFHMKSLSSDGQLISIPPVGESYYETRNALFGENPWLNKGCVFLSKRVEEWPSDDKDATRRCILHHPASATHLTQKPIDCVFFVCTEPREPKVPTGDVSADWHRALAVSYPNSVERFLALVEETPARQEDGAATAPTNP